MPIIHRIIPKIVKRSKREPENKKNNQQHQLEIFRITCFFFLAVAGFVVVVVVALAILSAYDINDLSVRYFHPGVFMRRFTLLFYNKEPKQQQHVKPL